MRSHVDPCMFAAFIHVPRAQMGPQLLAALRALNPVQGTAPDALLALMTPRSRQVEFHETYHVWQGMCLPFVHRYARLSWHKAMQAFGVLACSTPAYRQWDCMLPEFEVLTLEARVARRGQALFCAGARAVLPDALDEVVQLRPLDLMECAASLAEYQVTTTGDRCDPAVLARWAKRNPAYLLPYTFAARYLGDPRLALRAILPLLNATFHTTEPVRTYVELLMRLRSQFDGGAPDWAELRAAPEPCHWDAVFDMLLDAIAFEGPVNADGRLLGSPYHRLTREAWVGGAWHSGGDFLAHPFLSLPARAWQAAEQAQPELGLLMGQPGWVRPQTRHAALRRFAPMLTVYRFHVDGVNDRTVVTGHADGSGFTSLPVAGPSHWRGLVADVLTMYGAVRRASGAHFDSDQRTCHHRDCPHHGENFCNMFPGVPATHTACSFPERMRHLIDIHRS